MRRWIAIVLLVLLPAQMSWAAVVTCFGHSTGMGAEHAGHHHGHAGQGDAVQGADLHAEAASGGTIAGFTDIADMDCGHCLGHCPGMLLMAFRFVAPDGVDAPSSRQAASGSEHLPTQPERPQWSSLA
jgi:hypothetical protein